jgi:hypothetical protein
LGVGVVLCSGGLDEDEVLIPYDTLWLSDPVGEIPRCVGKFVDLCVLAVCPANGQPQYSFLNIPHIGTDSISGATSGQYIIKSRFCGGMMTEKSKVSAICQLPPCS